MFWRFVSRILCLCQNGACAPVGVLLLKGAPLSTPSPPPPTLETHGGGGGGGPPPPPPPHCPPLGGGGGVPQASFAKLGEMRSHWYENEFLFSYKYNSFSPNTRNSEMANRWRSFQLIWRVSATENSVLASKIDFKAILIVLFVGF